jgi:acyl-CoA synthetase (AMP-forming)/AMP-acid ligase II
VDVDLGLRLSFAEIAAAGHAAAKAFLAAGLQPREAVGLWAPNGWLWVAAALGASAAGGVLVPLNTRLRGREVADIVHRAKVRILLTAGEFLGQDYPAMLKGYSMPLLRTLITLSDERGASAMPSTAWPDFLAAGTDVDPQRLDARLAQLGPQDIADIMFTSGTTGMPKGSLFTHEKTLLAAQILTQATGLRASDRYLPFGPFAHTGGYKGGWLASLLAGSTIYAHNKSQAGGIMRLAAEEQITFLISPPTVLQEILADPARAQFDFSSLRFISTGGTMVPHALLQRVKSELGVHQVATGYGLTESGGMASFTRPDDPLELVAATAGRAVPGAEIKCVRADGTDAPIGEPGEVYIRTGKNMLGYLDDPDATAAVLTPDGWLRSGDVGWLDEAGNLRITDRLKDMYIVGGFNCYPAEIERVLSGYPGVQHCAVIGVPDERLGEVGRAFIVPAPGATLSEGNILDWCKTNFANYKVPRSIRFVDALPVNASGKVMKQVLRQSA